MIRTTLIFPALAGSSAAVADGFASERLMKQMRVLTSEVQSLKPGFPETGAGTLVGSMLPDMSA